MSNVHSLNVAADPVNQNAVEMIEDTLARLYSGEVIAVAVIEVRKGGSVATAYSKSSSYHQLNSEAARLAARLANDGGDLE